MLNDLINEIYSEFIIEAKDSPKLLEDMAAMERYMSESYNKRIFAELLQNADDCGSNRIAMSEYNGDIYFANDGRYFNGDDVISICRSGASSKQRGKSIGYRGVGFKSTTYLTNEILIYSGDVCFTFSKQKCSQVLNRPIDSIPTVRIPIPIKDEENSEINNHVMGLMAENYSTVFVFCNAKLDEFIEEISELSYGYFLFLRHVNECKIALHSCNKTFYISRTFKDNNQIVTVNNDKTQSWLIVSSNNVDIGFKYLEGNIVTCNSEEAVFHCYLPTLDKTPYPIKINGDFSTDPSRKHITKDEKTEGILNLVADLLFGIAKRTVKTPINTEFTNLFTILEDTSSFSKISIVLKDKFQSKIINNKWIETNNGNSISAKQYKTLPRWLEDSEKSIIRKNSDFLKSISLHNDVYNKILHIEYFISMYSSNEITTEDLINILEEESFVSSLNSETYGKLLGNTLKNIKNAQFIHNKSYSIDEIKLPTAEGIETLDTWSKNQIELQPECSQAISANTTESDLNWLCTNKNIKKEKLILVEKKNSEVSNIKHSKVNICHAIVSKWRSAEQQCIELEAFLGNHAVDVSKQNIGYDVESTTPKGEKRYIEVKLLSSQGSFSITNNEYTAAHQYEDSYYLCLLIPNEKHSKAIMVQNPLKNAFFEKRVRQWEWVCEQYNGEEISFEIR